jgi:hypothetical protein
MDSTRNHGLGTLEVRRAKPDDLRRDAFEGSAALLEHPRDAIEAQWQ